MNNKQRKHVKKSSYFTDNRIRKNKSMAKHRLSDNMREVAALNFLLKKRHKGPLLNDIYTILAMRNDALTPRNNTELEIKIGEQLNQNKEIVDLVLHRLFQWFGSNVGFAEISKLVEILKEWPGRPIHQNKIK